MNSYTFGPLNEYRVVVANDGHSRARALSLVYGVYLAAGLTAPRASRMILSCHDAVPDSTAFLVERLDTGSKASAVASLSLVPDSTLGLPMDESEHPRLAQLRSEGRRLVELVKLATVGATEQAWSKRHRPRELILRHLFKLAYLTARHIEKATDLIIAVAPPQEHYFRNVLLFESLSGAPDAVREKSSLSVPLRLRLDEAEQRFESRYGPKSGSGNLFRFFVGPRNAETLLWLKSVRHRLGAKDVHYLFTERSQLLKKADEATRRALVSFYPALADPAAMHWKTEGPSPYGVSGDLNPRGSKGTRPFRAQRPVFDTQ
ncbi:MAG: hypothetical protein WBP72_08520 [Rhodocyclaceae bacterium]